MLDKSLSMVDKIDDVKRFFTNQVLDKLLILGDKVTIILFFGKVLPLVAKNIQGPRDILDIKTLLAGIKADGPFTDIGNAIDFTYDYVHKEPDHGLRRHFILLTDGKQEAPEESRYFSTDFSIHHPFLESAKNIQKEGWKVHILGIGTDTEAQALADELAGASTIWNDTHSMLQEELQFDEEIHLKETPWITLHQGRPFLNLMIDSFGMNRKVNLKIKQILAFSNENAQSWNVLDQAFSTEIAHDQFSKIQIPLKENLPLVTMERATFVLQFDGETSLQPARFGASPSLFSLWQEWFLIFSGSLFFVIIFLLLATSWKIRCLRPRLSYKEKN